MGAVVLVLSAHVGCSSAQFQTADRSNPAQVWYIAWSPNPSTSLNLSSFCDCLEAFTHPLCTRGSSDGRSQILAEMRIR